MNNEIIITVLAVLGGFVYIIRGLNRKVGKLEGELKDSKIEGEIKLNEHKVNEAGKKAISSLDLYRKLREKSGLDKKPK